jgi:hypothetical protein
MIRIIVCDEFGEHGPKIKESISAGYGSDLSCQIDIVANWGQAFHDAQCNSNILAVIRCTAGIENYISYAKQLYPGVQMFFPLGSNNFEQLKIFANSEPPVIVSAGAGDEEQRNNTAYGNGLEFWDRDFVQTSQPSSDESSFSTGIILGKLLFIKDALKCNWWKARYRARITAERNEINRSTSPWDLRNGYGRINALNAVNYSGDIPADPYIPKKYIGLYRNF